MIPEPHRRATAPNLPPDSDHLIVILGAGHSGGRAAEALRTAGFQGSVTVVGDESHPPYERPPLSKELLAGTYAVERTYIKPREYYEQAGIALRLGSAAVAIDREAQRVRLADGATLPYDSLLLTMGARPRRLACRAVAARASITCGTSTTAWSCARCSPPSVTSSSSAPA